MTETTIGHQENFNLSLIPQWKIVFAVTSNLGYDIDRIILVENYPDDDDLLLIHGSHCSCYGFDDTQWDATWYTKDELIQIAKGWMDTGSGAETIAAPLLINYLFRY